MPPVPWFAGLAERSELLRVSIQAGASPTQLKAIVGQLLWSAGTNVVAAPIERADALCAEVSKVTGKHYSSLVTVQKDLN